MSLCVSLKEQENHIRFCKKRPFNGLERHTGRAPGSIRSFTKNTVNVTKNMSKIMAYQYKILFFQIICNGSFHKYLIFYFYFYHKLDHTSF